jgi:hypothetical protein
LRGKSRGHSAWLPRIGLNLKRVVGDLKSAKKVARLLIDLVKWDEFFLLKVTGCTCRNEIGARTSCECACLHDLIVTYGEFCGLVS